VIACTGISYRAQINIPASNSEAAALLRCRAKETESRERLCIALKFHAESVPGADAIVAEHLGMRVEPEDTAPKRLLRCIPWLPGAFADDLREAVLARGPASAPAQAEQAAA